MNQTNSWNSADEIISAELEPNERLLWAGRPRQGFILRKADVATYLFGLTLAAMLFFPAAFGINNGMPVRQLLMSVPVLIFLSVLLFGRLISDVWHRARTVYGVTSERVLFVSSVFGRQIKSLELDSMRDAWLMPRGSSGGGVIRFGCDATPRREKTSQQVGWLSVSSLNAFELEREARAVFQLVRAALRGPVRGFKRSVEFQRAPKSDDQPDCWEQPDEVIRPELKPGELLLWAGRPRLGYVVNWHDIIGLIIAFVWMNVFFVGGGLGAALWFLLVFKAIHVAVHAGRVILSARRRSRTAYAVTTERVIVMSAARTRHLMSLDLGAIAEVTLSQRGETGGSTILIGPDIAKYPTHASIIRAGGTPPGMLRLDLTQDAQLVYRLIRRTRQPLAAGPY
jgi:hypothetical protein